MQMTKKYAGQMKRRYEHYDASLLKAMREALEALQSKLKITDGASESSEFKHYAQDENHLFPAKTRLAVQHVRIQNANDLPYSDVLTMQIGLAVGYSWGEAARHRIESAFRRDGQSNSRPQFKSIPDDCIPPSEVAIQEIKEKQNAVISNLFSSIGLSPDGAPYGAIERMQEDTSEPAAGATYQYGEGQGFRERAIRRNKFRDREPVGDNSSVRIAFHRNDLDSILAAVKALEAEIESKQTKNWVTQATIKEAGACISI